MTGEYVQADTIENYWHKLKSIYEERSIKWEDLTEEQYESIKLSEREDSDNHINEERLGKGTNVIDICHYKYLPERWVAYKIEVVHSNGEKKFFYFKIQLKENIN